MPNILTIGLANSAEASIGCKLSSISRANATGLNTDSGFGVVVDENRLATSSGIEGVLVTEGVLVMVGVSVMVGVNVIVPVSVTVGVCVTVGEGGKMR